MDEIPSEHSNAAPPYSAVPPYTAVPPAYGEVPPASGTVPPGPVPPMAASGLTDNTAAALAYVTFIPAIIFLVTEPYNKNPFIRFHAFQSLGLAAVGVVCWILQIVLLVIPILGFLLSMLIFLGLVAIWCFTVFKAYQGEWFKLPLIGDFALTKSKGL